MLDWLLCILVRSVGWLFCQLPPGVCVRVGMCCGELASWVQPKRVWVGRQNLKAAFGDRLSPAQANRMIRQVFRELGAGLVEMLRLPVMDQAYVTRYIEFERFDYLVEAVKQKRPVILLTGHLGNWELSSVVSASIGYPLMILARQQKDFPKLYRLLVSYRESKGCRVVHKGSELLQLVRALKQGAVVGIAGDQASRRGVWVDFFGRSAQFTTGPFEIAQLSGALVIPVFIHRRRGPQHRIVMETPFEVSAGPDRRAAVEQGIETFARLLQRHIERDPSQWLWAHKRWKHTPDRRVLVVSDGKLGHVKQSLAVVQALKAQSARMHEQVCEVQYRSHFARIIALGWAWLMPWGWGANACVRLTLRPQSYRRLASSYADLIVSCGASTAPINRLLSRINRAKSIVIMNPAPLPLRRFDLAFIPLHDRVPNHRNVVRTYGALTMMTEDQLAAAHQQLRVEHPVSSSKLHADRPGIAVLVGGDTDDYQLTTAFADSLIRQVLAACEDLDVACMVTTSRRTPPAVERLLAERLEGHPRCQLLLLASRDSLNGTLEGIVGWAQAIVVTGESISMVSEACASGRHVVVVEPPLRHASRAACPKQRTYLRLLSQEGYVHTQVVPQVGHTLRQLLAHPSASRRLDVAALIHDAVKRVL